MEAFTQTEDGQSLKTALLRQLNLNSRAAGDLIRTGQVKVNGVRTRENVTLARGDRLEVYLPAARTAPPPVLFAGEHVLVVEKPTGAAVCDTPGLTVTELLRRGGWPTVRPVHRLDVYTGGVLFFALDDEAEEALGQLIRDRALTKIYECVVRGTPKPAEAVRKAYLRKDADAARVDIFDREVRSSREIVTGYEVLKTDGALRRLKVTLFTGRTHQIRAHLAHLGYPLVGDDLYGDRVLNKARRLSHPLLWSVASTVPGDVPPVLAEIAGKTFTSPARFPQKIGL